MCDYSAKSAQQRAAAKDDHLVTRSISSHTRGFTPIGDPATAVCLLPGTELAFDKPVQIDEGRILGIFKAAKTLPHTVARSVSFLSPVRMLAARPPCASWGRSVRVRGSSGA
jgi:hypothetical protein